MSRIIIRRMPSTGLYLTMPLDCFCGRVEGPWQNIHHLVGDKHPEVLQVVCTEGFGGGTEKGCGRYVEQGSI